jgi:peptide/nickel transport system permease protein
MPEDYFEQTFASQLAQGTITREQLQAMKELYHLGDSTFMGILGGYWDWLTDVFQGDLGISLKYGKPVAEVIVQNMGISFGISLVAMILEYIIAIPLGIKAACNQYGKIDYTVTVLTMMGISLPTFFLAALLIQVFAVNLGWFPVSGLASANLSVDASSWTRFWDVAWHLFLPMLTLVILSIGGLMRHTRTNMLEVLNADYIRTARAKGLSEGSVIYKHAFKNTMIPIVTMTAGIIPSLFGGAMITETVFGIPGIGKLAYDAMKVGDVPFIMGYNMFLAVLTVLGTLLSDLMYVLVDPRVKLTK